MFIDSDFFFIGESLIRPSCPKLTSHPKCWHFIWFQIAECVHFSEGFITLCVCVFKCGVCVVPPQPPSPHPPSHTHKCVSTGRSRAVSLPQIFFVRASMVSYVTFVLLLFAPYLAFFWCLWACFVILALPGYLPLYFWRTFPFRI